MPFRYLWATDYARKSIFVFYPTMRISDRSPTAVSPSYGQLIGQYICLRVFTGRVLNFQLPTLRVYAYSWLQYPSKPSQPTKLPILNPGWLSPSSQGAVILSVLRSLIVRWSEQGVNSGQVDSPHHQHLGTSHRSRLLSRLGCPTSLLLPSDLPPKIFIGSGRWLAIWALALRVCQTRL